MTESKYSVDKCESKSRASFLGELKQKYEGTASVFDKYSKVRFPMDEKPEVKIPMDEKLVYRLPMDKKKGDD